MSSNNTLYQGDLIGNPLLYPYQTETGEIIPGYDISPAGLWSVYREKSKDMISGVSISYGKKIIDWGLLQVIIFVPNTIQEILDSGYLDQIGINDIGFSEVILNEIKSSNIRINSLLRVNKKGNGNIIFYKKTGSKTSGKGLNSVFENFGIPGGVTN